MSDAFIPERIAQLREALAKPKDVLGAAVWAQQVVSETLDEIERLQAEVAAESRLCTQAYRKLSDAHAEYAAATALHDVTKDELSRVKAELDEAVGLLKPTINEKVDKKLRGFADVMKFSGDVQGTALEMLLDNNAKRRSFLSRMEGRKDG